MTFIRSFTVYSNFQLFHCEYVSCLSTKNIDFGPSQPGFGYELSFVLVNMLGSYNLKIHNMFLIFDGSVLSFKSLLVQGEWSCRFTIVSFFFCQQITNNFFLYPDK